jgi:hypothetical protein
MLRHMQYLRVNRFYFLKESEMQGGSDVLSSIACR